MQIGRIDIVTVGGRGCDNNDDQPTLNPLTTWSSEVLVDECVSQQVMGGVSGIAIVRDRGQEGQGRLHMAGVLGRERQVFRACNKTASDTLCINNTPTYVMSGRSTSFDLTRYSNAASTCTCTADSTTYPEFKV
jgi:hypothetical protein